ncbi:MAG: SDR family NAD(P)-dependent oxidoreductase [bacterium]
MDKYIDFTGKTVLITGAAAGIGAACARGFAKAGANLCLVDIADDSLAQLQTDLSGSYNGQVFSQQCDVSQEQDCLALASELERRSMDIDILINNAGIISTGDILDLPVSEFDRVMNVNLRAPFMLTQIFATKMVDKRIQGTIINMSSLNSVLAIPNQLAYVTSKGGLQQLTKACALALAPHKIRVNAIGPGSIMTDILKVVMQDEAARDKILSRTPMGRVGDPDEIANVALFLASDMASYLTGQTIFPDGGRSALNYTVPVNG